MNNTKYPKRYRALWITHKNFVILGYYEGYDTFRIVNFPDRQYNTIRVNVDDIDSWEYCKPAPSGQKDKAHVHTYDNGIKKD